MTALSSMGISGSTSILVSDSPMAVTDQLFANFALPLNNAQKAYQSELSSLWQSIDALAVQRLDKLLSMEGGAMGLSKDILTRDFLFARTSSTNG